MVTVASIPAAHPYVSSVVDPARVTVLRDPVPAGATQPGQWWPPQWLEPDYLESRLGGVDLVHVHFGFDSHPPDQLAEIAAMLRRRDIPLVVTVHDLHNPHFTDQAAHSARLDVLVPAATTVITLTNGAAAEIGWRWGRQAVVLPHPHVLPIHLVGAGRTRRIHPIVGIHAKNLRANIDPWPLVEHMLDRDDGGLRLRLDLDDDVLGAPRAHESSPARLARYRDAGVDVRVHRRFSDRELADYLTEVDVLVLPYRHGTHSGWVEACHDAGVQAVVPDCGYFHHQHGDPVFGYGSGYFDKDSFDTALNSAAGAARQSSISEDRLRRSRRREQRRGVQESMSLIYREALVANEQSIVS